MAAPKKNKVSPDEWESLRSTWEADPRPGYTWLVNESGVSVTPQAIRKRATKDNWIKAADNGSNQQSNQQSNQDDEVPTDKESTTDSVQSDHYWMDLASAKAGDDVSNVGRPTLYRHSFNEQVYKLCLAGFTDKKLADFFGISESTLNTWKIKHPEFLESMKSGKEIADAEVAASMYARAIGYTYDAVHVAVFMGEAIITPIEKHVPPDVAAQRMWLKNRQGWRDNPEPVEEIDSSSFPDEDELDQRYAESLEKSRVAALEVIGRGQMLGMTIDRAGDVE
jgi:hypothetical protein